jgi:YgiT-type zinc finger domain-containing protein
MKRTKCPMCNRGTLVEKNIKEKMRGIYLGTFPAEVCTHCGESFTSADITSQIIEIAKAKKVWRKY